MSTPQKNIAEGQLDDVPALIERDDAGNMRGYVLPKDYQLVRTVDRIVAIVDRSTLEKIPVEKLNWEPIVTGAGLKVLVFKPRQSGFIKDR